MTSTRIKNLARAIQRANPGMKYTEALRNAEAGRIVVDPDKVSNEAFVDLYRAAGIDVTVLDLPEQGSGEAPDPVSLSAPSPLKPDTEAQEEGGSAKEDLGSSLDSPVTQVSFDPNGDFLPLGDPTPEPRINYVDKDRPVHDLRSSLWDGETHPDPLTFLIGHDLRTKKAHYVSLNGSTPHMMIAGGTATGKSSTAEIITAQALTTPMPWDSDLFSTVMVMDPLGVAARVWAGRRGVIAVNGADVADEPDQDGNLVPGDRVMASALEWVTAEWTRRAAILSQHGAPSWTALPDEVKREERFAPLFVVVDEYRDPADPEDATWETSRRHILNLVRKGRAFGMHLIATSNDPARPAFGLSTSGFGTGILPVLTGQASNDDLEAFFGPRDVPDIPVTRESIKDGERSSQTVPGRARIPDTENHEIDLIQVLHIGQNWKALDKWLPRGEAPPNGNFTPASGGRSKQG